MPKIRLPNWVDAFVTLAYQDFELKEIAECLNLNERKLEPVVRRLKLSKNRTRPGQVYGRLRVVKSSGKFASNGQIIWQCECLCGSGKTKLVPSGELRRGHTRSCGCLIKDAMVNKWYDTSLSWFKRIKNQANVRGIIFDIDPDYVLDILKKQRYKCAITGLDINLKKIKFGTGSTASLDRINSSLGYIKGNVWWTHADVNRMKWQLTVDRFLDISKRACDRKDEIYKLMNEVKNYG